jgi:hypothetical protein
MELWNFFEITTLYSIWKVQRKCIFDNDVSFVSSFLRIWQEEICFQLQVKGVLLIRDAKIVEVFANLDLVSVLLVQTKIPSLHSWFLYDCTYFIFSVYIFSV